MDLKIYSLAYRFLFFVISISGEEVSAFYLVLLYFLSFFNN